MKAIYNNIYFPPTTLILRYLYRYPHFHSFFRSKFVLKSKIEIMMKQNSKEQNEFHENTQNR